jgi:hypothetical protein
MSGCVPYFNDHDNNDHDPHGYDHKTATGEIRETGRLGKLGFCRGEWMSFWLRRRLPASNSSQEKSRGGGSPQTQLANLFQGFD